MQLIKINLLSVLLFCIAILCWFYRLAASDLFAEDLPAHAEIIQRMIEVKSLFFYDRFWFSGWPAFQFYGFLPHLITAITSGIFSEVFSLESIIRFYSILACALLPFSFFYASSALTSRCSGIIVGFISIWFLLLDEAFYGLGIKSILGVGLFPQVFGWHLILLGMASILNNSRYLPLVLALTLVTHTLSGFFLILFAICWLIINPQNKKHIVFSLLISFGTISFWLYPFLKYSSEYTSADVYQTQRDWLSLLFRYPITEIDLLSLNYDFFRLIFLLTIAYFIFSWKALNSDKSIKLTFCILLLSLFTLSNYLASSNPLAMHYYRISGLLVLPVLVLINFILSEIFYKNKIAAAALILVLLIATINMLRLEKDSLKLAKVDNEITSTIDILKQSKGRVFVEYNANYQQVAQYSSHYIESKLKPVEVLNGLFVESSNLSRYIAFSAEQLNAGSFHGYLVFINGTDIDQQTALRQFQSLGVSRILATSESFSKNLENIIGQAIYQNSNYKIFEVTPDPVLQEISKPIVAYLDLKKQLPFKIVSQYFYANSKLFNNYELIDLGHFPIPKNIKYLMINGDKNSILKYLSSHKTSASVIAFFEKAALDFKHSNKNYPVDKKVEIYKKVKNFFDKKLKLVQRFEDQVSTTAPTEFDYEWNGQNLILKNLVPDHVYKLNYSYSPLLFSPDLRLYRGLAERIYIVPNKEGTHTINFNLLQLSYYPLVLIISFISFITLIMYSRTND